MKFNSNDTIVELRPGEILSASKFPNSLINNSTTCCSLRRTLHLAPSTLRVMIKLRLMGFPFLNDFHQRPLHVPRQCSTTQWSRLHQWEVPLLLPVVPGGAVLIVQNLAKVALIVMRRLLLCGDEIHPQWNPSVTRVVYTCNSEINFDPRNSSMQMMMEAHRMSQTQTMLDLNVATVALITHPSGEGAKLEISFVTHVVCMLAFGENLDLCLSKETKFDRDLNTFPSEQSS